MQINNRTTDNFTNKIFELMYIVFSAQWYSNYNHAILEDIYKISSRSLYISQMTLTIWYQDSNDYDWMNKLREVPNLMDARIISRLRYPIRLRIA